MKQNIIYGKNTVIEALRSNVHLDKIFISQGKKDAAINQLARERGVPVREVNRRKLKELVGHENHQGVVAMITQAAYGSISDMLECARQKSMPPTIVLLDEIQDPHNLGAIARSADAFGIHGIIIPKDRSVGLTDTVAKTSAGAIHHITIARVTNLARTIDELKNQGLWILGTDQNSTQKINEVDLTLPLGIVIGSEGKGIRRLIKEKCDFLVQLPMHGKINSLNASVAAAIVFWEIQRRRSHTDKIT